MSCGCPNCLTPKRVFGVGGQIGTATPFATGTNVFQRICFSPPFLTGGSQDVACVDTYATESGCVYDAECPGNQTCFYGECRPKSVKKNVPFSRGNNTIPPINPFEIASWAKNDPGIGQILPKPFGRSRESIDTFIESTCPGGGGLLLVSDQKNNPALVCPYFPGHERERNCANSVRSLEQCDMRRGFLSDDEYSACKSRESCFLYDIALQNGTVHPMGYKVTPECVKVAQNSLKKCGVDCSPNLRAYI